MHPDGNAEGFFRQDLFNVFRPFDDAEGPAVDVVAKSDVEGFGNLRNPVEIEMIHRRSGARLVGVDAGEGRGADSIFPNAQLTADRRGERGLSSPHRGIESNDPAVSDFLQENFRSLVQVLQILDDDFVIQVR